MVTLLVSSLKGLYIEETLHSSLLKGMFHPQEHDSNFLDSFLNSKGT